jgi:DNA-binding IclR family transcriptional regulator
MKLGHNQLRILRFIAEQAREVTFSEIVEQFKTQYYTNAAHYVSQSLASMVKNGFVERVRKGVYIVGTGKKPAKTQEADNQPTLF